MDNAKKISGFSAFALLCLPMVWNFEAAAVGPALGSLMEAFPGESDLKIQLILAFPFITSVIFSIISGKLARYFDKKHIAIVGLLLYGVTGIMPAFVDNLTTILVLRLFTGVGVGLVLPLANQMIVENYKGEKREKMLGLATSTFNSSNVAISLVIGFLLVFGWQMAFYSFGFVLVIGLIAVLGLPKSPPLTKQKGYVVKEKGNETKVKLPKYAYLMAFYMLGIWLLFSAFAQAFSMYVVSDNLAPIWMMGILMSLPGLASVFSGAIFPFLNKYLKQYYLFVTLVLFGLGFVSLSLAKSPTLLIVGTLLTGLGHGALVPYITNLTSLHANESQKDDALALVTAMIHLAGIFAPFVISFVMSLGNAKSYSFLYTIYSILLFAIAVIALVINMKNKGKKSHTDLVNNQDAIIK